MATLYKYQTQGGQEVTYLDADDAYQPEDIRQHWAQTFPELGSAQTDEQKKTQTVEANGQSVEVDRVVTFAKKVGTKGADNDNDQLRSIMDELDYPLSCAVVDRETLLRLNDLETAIQTLRGLNHLRANAGNGLPANLIVAKFASQLWQTVYLALRLFDYAYPKSPKTPHERFGPVADRSAVLHTSIALEDALEENAADDIATAARELLVLLNINQ